MSKFVLKEIDFESVEDTEEINRQIELICEKGLIGRLAAEESLRSLEIVFDDVIGPRPRVDSLRELDE